MIGEDDFSSLRSEILIRPSINCFFALGRSFENSPPISTRIIMKMKLLGVRLIESKHTAYTVILSEEIHGAARSRSYTF